MLIDTMGLDDTNESNVGKKGDKENFADMFI